MGAAAECSWYNIGMCCTREGRHMKQDAQLFIVQPSPPDVDRVPRPNVYLLVRAVRTLRKVFDLAGLCFGDDPCFLKKKRWHALER